jgi:hypothetical protein
MHILCPNRSARDAYICFWNGPPTQGLWSGALLRSWSTQPRPLHTPAGAGPARVSRGHRVHAVRRGVSSMGVSGMRASPPPCAWGVSGMRASHPPRAWGVSGRDGVAAARAWGVSGRAGVAAAPCVGVSGRRASQPPCAWGVSGRAGVAAAPCVGRFGQEGVAAAVCVGRFGRGFWCGRRVLVWAPRARKASQLQMVPLWRCSGLDRLRFQTVRPRNRAAGPQCAG